MFPGCLSISCKSGGFICVTLSHQPSWAHVVRGARSGSQHPQFPLPPPLPLLPPPAGKLCSPISAGAVQLAKSRLEEVGERFGVAGVHPDFRDQYVREQLDKKSKAVSLSECQI